MIHGVVKRWRARRALRAALEVAPLYRALLAINTTLGVIDPKTGTTTIADPIGQLECARSEIESYLETL